MLYSLPELKQLARENNLGGLTLLNKPELIKLLTEKNIIFEPTKPVKEKKIYSPKYDYLKTVDRTPISVVIKNMETNETKTLRSIRAAAQYINTTIYSIKTYNGKVLKEKYFITLIK